MVALHVMCIALHAILQIILHIHRRGNLHLGLTLRHPILKIDRCLTHHGQHLISVLALRHVVDLVASLLAVLTAAILNLI